MRKRVLIALALVAVVGAATVLAGSVGAIERPAIGDRSPPAKTLLPATITGRVELVPGVGVKGCEVRLEGTRKRASCTAGGLFVMRGAPPGEWIMRIRTTSPAGIPIYRLHVGANTGAADAVRVVVARPGAVTGRVTGLSDEQLGKALVLVPTLGIASLVNEQGRYLLNGVPEGANTVELRVLGAVSKQPITREVTVPPLDVATNVNFNLGRPSGPGTPPAAPPPSTGG